MSKLIATTDEGRYLLIREKGYDGFIADTQDKSRSPTMNTLSAINRGYWTPVENDPELVKLALSFKQCPSSEATD